MQLPSIRVPKSFMKFRGATSSEDLTEFVNNATQDLTNLFIAIEENSNKLTELKSVTNVENRCLIDMITNLEAEIQVKNEIIAGNNITNYYATVKDMMTEGSSNPANMSIEYQQVTPSNNQYTPKLYLHDNVSDKNLIPKTLLDNVVIEQTILDTMGVVINSGDVITTDNGISNAFDGNLTTCWQRVIKVPEDKNAKDVTVRVIFPIPFEVVSNRVINTISITTHPIRGIDILNVELKSGDEWLQIEGFTSHSLYNNNILPNARPVRFFFNNTASLEVRITMRQNKYLTENIRGINMDIFYIGAYDIDVGYTELKNRSSEFNIGSTQKGLILGSGSLGVTIHEITAISDNLPLAPSLFNYQLYCILSDYTMNLVANPFPVSILSNKILLMCTITAQGSVIPTINSLRIRYNSN